MRVTKYLLNFIHQNGRVLFSYLMGVDKLDFEERTTGLSFNLVSLFDFLLVEQLRAT